MAPIPTAPWAARPHFKHSQPPTIRAARTPPSKKRPCWIRNGSTPIWPRSAGSAAPPTAVNSSWAEPALRGQIGVDPLRIQQGRFLLGGVRAARIVGGWLCLKWRLAAQGAVGIGAIQEGAALVEGRLQRVG